MFSDQQTPHAEIGLLYLRLLQNLGDAYFSLQKSYMGSSIMVQHLYESYIIVLTRDLIWLMAFHQWRIELQIF